MKYLIAGLIIMISAIVLSIGHANELAQEQVPVNVGFRPISFKSLVFPYMVVLGMITAFVGMVKVVYGKPKKKKNYYGL